MVYALVSKTIVCGRTGSSPVVTFLKSLINSVGRVQVFYEIFLKITCSRRFEPCIGFNRCNRWVFSLAIRCSIPRNDLYSINGIMALYAFAKREIGVQFPVSTSLK